MSLVVTRAKVKEKCGIEVTDYDTPIDNLIAEFVPMLEYAIDPGALADTGNAGLQATLNLGANEVVAGEFLAQLARRFGAYDWVVFGDVELRPLHNVSPDDPMGLKAQGVTRLGPYLKDDVAVVAPRPVGFVGGKAGEES